MPLSFFRRRAAPRCMTDLTSAAALKAALEHSHETPIVLFKHSMTCPISASAASQVAGLGAEGDPPVYRIVVQTARAVSYEAERLLGVRHESPQVIVVKDGEARFHASHFGVQLDRIRTEAAV